MDKDEAREILTEALAPYRTQTYELLQRLLDEQDYALITSDSGVEYNLKIHAVWDSRSGGDLRVFGEIDDGGLRWFCPLCNDFIIAPDGTFVGE